MNFYFDSWAEFLQMGGHGAYVWACYLITWAVLAYLLISPVVRKRRWMRRQAALQRRTAAARTPERAETLTS
ncbi:heme exporter protein CcmD [Marinimicrobium agarilyticum]|uniref:heme exporter protein CcmD n=1 Tax=Marinimicrobium agarilyticum TaxID=306546 RepID=UPI0004089B8F|nr:heme exporter protein CcmD [Marinimicrobium agarilyticum]